MATASLAVSIVVSDPPPDARFVRPDGNDANPGTADTPAGAWRTLAHAALQAQPGQTVLVRPGAYAGMNLPRSGTASARITFRADPAHGAVITTPDTSGGIAVGVLGSGREYVTVEGFAFHPAAGPRWDAAIRFNAGPVGGIWRYGNVYRNNRALRRATADTYYHAFYASWQDGILVEGNTVEDAYNSGIYVANSSRNYAVRTNTVRGSGGNGIHNNGDAGAGPPGVNRNALIEANVVSGCGFSIGGQAISCDGLQDSRVQNNLLLDNVAKGFSLYVTNASAGSRNNVVVNNTVVHAVAASGSPFRLPGGGNTGNVVFNNVFLARGTNINSDGHYSYAVEDDSDFDYNAVTDPVQRQISLASWRNSGNDVHAVVVAPAMLLALFVDPAAGNYHPKPGGPLAGTGTPVFLAKMAPVLDIGGNARSGPVNIGCW